MYRLPAMKLPALVALALVLVGCQQPLRPGLLNDATAYYDRAEYDQAYKAATLVVRRGHPDQRHEAALIAGLAARQKGDARGAERYLSQAARSSDPAIAGDALASLGLLYAQEQRHEASAAALLRAAEFLQGQPRANAYFYAAVAQQKLARWPQARTNLILARAASNDPQFIAQVNERLDVVGWTLQLGAFRDRDNARQLASTIAGRADDARLGNPRIVESTDRNGDPLAVVQLGQFTTFQSASRARDRLGENAAIIIPLAGR